MIREVSTLVSISDSRFFTKRGLGCFGFTIEIPSYHMQANHSESCVTVTLLKSCIYIFICKEEGEETRKDK